jgi:hypothetical protein
VGMARSGGEKRWHDRLSGTGRKGNELMGGARESAVGERRDGVANCATPRRKRNPANTPRRFRPTGVAKEAGILRRRAGRHSKTGPNPRGVSNGYFIF